MRDINDVGYDELVALRGRCSVKLKQICLPTCGTIQSNMPPGPLEIKTKSYLTDNPPSDMPTNTVKLYQPPAGKGMTSWLSFVVSNCEFVTFPLVSWVRCGT